MCVHVCVRQTLSFALAEKEGAKVVLANDPDADRLAAAEKQDESVPSSVNGDTNDRPGFKRVCFCFSGRWRVFTGNELGALLGWWMFHSWKQQNAAADAAAVKRLYMLSSTVSSKILRAIALKEGFHFEVASCHLPLFALLLGLLHPRSSTASAPRTAASFELIVLLLFRI